MPTPNAYASIARFVGRHRRYFIGAGLGGLVVLFAALGILAALNPKLPDWAFPFFYFGAWFVALHWPFLVAWYWFHPAVTARVHTRSRLAGSLHTIQAWIFSSFLTLYLLAALLAPPLIYFLPGNPEPVSPERAVQQDVAD